ncbi:hypothetical protein NGUA36_00007 [Salmonella enterica]|nr:hypothetical protein NGUA36_00007 [Salmonella enterica]
MMWRRHQIFTWRGFYRPAAAYNVAFVSPLTHHLQVVAPPQNGGITVLIQSGPQAKNLRLRRWFHCVGGFISDQESRLIRQRDSDHHFLTLAIGQFIGKTAHRVFLIFNSHPVQ